MHDAYHVTVTSKEAPSIEPAHRRAVNDRLRETRPGHVCAVLLPNPKTAGAPKPRPTVTIVPLPRPSVGKPPRRGVHIPLSGVAAVVANTRVHGRAVVNPRHQRPYIKRKDRK